jgi:hypothetical protein
VPVIQQKRTSAEIGGKVRHRVVVTGEECSPPPTNEARFHWRLMMQWLAENEHLLMCGYSVPDKIHIFHNGASWQAEAEAEVDKESS